MAVAAVNDQGVQSSYSESGANLWVSAPGGEFCSTHAITTVDRTGVMGFNTATTAGTTDYADQAYTKCMNGTSAAAPTAAGVVALMLAANPKLGWRDVRIILASTARKNDVAAGGWWTNGGGYHFSHKYGFGVVDATAAVTAAKAYATNVGTQVVSTLYSSPVLNLPIPDNNMVTGVSNTITVASSGISSIEWVEVTFTATHPIIADIDVALTSPNGTVSQLAVPHSCAGANFACTSKYTGWVFGSAAHLGEAANGNWTLTVKDGYSGTVPNTGTFDSWKIQFYGH
jgi:kexin